MNGYVNFLSYLGVSFSFLVIGIVLFTISTPKINEFKLIAQKNIAAAMLLGGKVMGLAIVLGAAVEYSISLMDMAIWGAIGIVTQIIVFFIAELITVRFSLQKAIQEDNRAVATILLSLSLAVGWIVAKCLSY